MNAFDDALIHCYPHGGREHIFLNRMGNRDEANAPAGLAEGIQWLFAKFSQTISFSRSH